VEGRAALAGLQAKQRAGAKLTKDEKEKEKQLELFAADDEEP
jgi:hypothetical protein